MIFLLIHVNIIIFRFDKMFHIQNPAIRRRLASSFNNICRHLVVRDAEQESIQELLIQSKQQVSESSAVILSRQYKSYAYGD